MSRRKVVVTGLGLITPIGLDGESTWRSLLEGRSGVARIQAFDPTEFRTQIAAEVRDFDPASVMDLEEVFNITIPEEDQEKLRTVQDAIDYLEAHLEQ